MHGLVAEPDGSRLLRDTVSGSAENPAALGRELAERILAAGAGPLLERLRAFAASLDKAFYSFEPDFFQQNLLRIVDDVVGIIKASIQLWPTLVEIAYFEKRRNGLPRKLVRNQKK